MSRGTNQHEISGPFGENIRGTRNAAASLWRWDDVILMCGKRGKKRDVEDIKRWPQEWKVLLSMSVCGGRQATVRLSMNRDCVTDFHWRFGAPRSPRTICLTRSGWTQSCLLRGLLSLPCVLLWTSCTTQNQNHCITSSPYTYCDIPNASNSFPQLVQKFQDGSFLSSQLSNPKQRTSIQKHVKENEMSIESTLHHMVTQSSLTRR